MWSVRVLTEQDIAWTQNSWTQLDTVQRRFKGRAQGSHKLFRARRCKPSRRVKDGRTGRIMGNRGGPVEKQLLYGSAGVIR